MTQDEPRRPIRWPTLVVGAAFILLGLLFLCAQLANTFFHWDIGSYLWPFWIIVPGVLFYAWGLAVRNQGGVGLAIFGSIVTAVGLLLLLQSVTDLWATWAYAWALVAPTSIGLGLALYGAVKRQAGLLRSGTRLAGIGFAIFAGFAIFFELVLDISGLGFGRVGRVVLPALLVVGGIAVLVFALAPRRRKV